MKMKIWHKHKKQYLRNSLVLTVTADSSTYSFPNLAIRMDILLN